MLRKRKEVGSLFSAYKPWELYSALVYPPSRAGVGWKETRSECLSHVQEELILVLVESGAVDFDGGVGDDPEPLIDLKQAEIAGLVTREVFYLSNISAQLGRRHNSPLFDWLLHTEGDQSLHLV
jgi:hypothetical protein